jgi:hypothetical protein
VEKDGVECDSSSLGLPEWTFQRADETHLLTKLLKVAQPLGQAARGRIYRGVITGLNEAFIIDGRLRLEMVNRDPSSSDMIKRVLRGQDLRPWYQEDEDRWLIVVPSGFTRSRLGAGADAESAWNRFRESYPAIAAHLAPYEEAARRRQDQGEFWWELRSCDYYAEFDKPKIFWPDIAKLPRFSWDETGALIGNTGHILTGASPALLGILQSRAIWFVISQICQPLRLRAGLWQYRLFPQFMERLPIPELSPDQENTLSNLAIRLTALARHRYALHRDARHRIQTDLGKPERELNRKLTDWWTLSFSTFRLEVREVLGSEIPVSERGQWEAWLDQQREEHRCLTSDIVTLETQLNARVFELFDLAKPEIELIETSTKYRYGEP